MKMNVYKLNYFKSKTQGTVTNVYVWWYRLLFFS